MQCFQQNRLHTLYNSCVFRRHDNSRWQTLVIEYVSSRRGSCGFSVQLIYLGDTNTCRDAAFCLFCMCFQQKAWRRT